MNACAYVLVEERQGKTVAADIIVGGL